MGRRESCVAIWPLDVDLVPKTAHLITIRRGSMKKLVYYKKVYMTGLTLRKSKLAAVCQIKKGQTNRGLQSSNSEKYFASIKFYFQLYKH